MPHAACRMAVLIALLFAGPSMSVAANDNVGTSGAPFLRIGAGARPTAMGEAFVGLADDVNAAYYNPAGLAYLNGAEITAMHVQWFQDINYEFGAFAYPTEAGAFAVTAATLKVEDQQRRGLDESLLGTFETLDSAYALSYARMMHPRLSAGGTVRFIDQEIGGTSASTWSGDAGVLYRLSGWPVSLGLAARHFGQEVEFNDESDPLPFVVDFGAGLNLYDGAFKVGANVKMPRDNDLQFGLGGEWNVALQSDFRAAVRAGIGTAGTDADGASGISLGGGLGFRLFTFDMAWVPFGDLGNTFRYAAHVRFK